MKKVEVSIYIKTTTEKVIQAFTDSKILEDWWGVEKSFIQKHVGGLYTLAWKISKKGMQYISTGTIKNYNPKNTIEIENFIYLSPDKSFLGPMHFMVRATNVNNKTEVYLCQSGYQEGNDWNWYYEAVKAAWPEVMKTLKAYLEKV